jgi:hypothetical protein
VFFDELGPPWPKHPCTDNPVVRNLFSSSRAGAEFLLDTESFEANADLEVFEGDQAKSAESPPITNLLPAIAWSEAGWMPFIVTKLVPRRIGIEVEGNLFVSSNEQPIPFRIAQTASDARFYRVQDQYRVGFILVQNTSPLLSALNECPVFLKKDPDLRFLSLSTFIMTPDGEVQEITCAVLGFELGA